MSSHHQPIEQTVERMPDGVRRLAAQLLTPVSADQIWAVLTDYDGAVLLMVLAGLYDR